MGQRWIAGTASFELVFGKSRTPYKSLYEAVQALKAADKITYLLTPDGSRWGACGNGVIRFRMAKAAGAGN